MKHRKQLIGLFGSIALMVTLPSTGLAECMDVCTLDTNSLIRDTNGKIDDSNATLGDIRDKIETSNSMLSPLEPLLESIDNNVHEIYKALKPEEGEILDIYAEFIASYNAAYQAQTAEASNTQASTTAISDEFIGGSKEDENQDKALSNTKKMMNGNYSSLSANSLFDGSEYDDNQKTSANRYIKALAGTALPTTVVDPGADGAAKLTNRNNTMAAVQSLNAYNLSALVAKRTGKPEEKNALGIVTSPAEPSGQSILDHIYETMVSDPTFLTNIASDTTMDLSKKSLYLLVGAFTALYRIEQNQQQMLAAQSATNSMLIMLAQVMAEMQPNAGIQGEEAEAGAAAQTGVEGSGANEGLAPVEGDEE